VTAAAKTFFIPLPPALLRVSIASANLLADKVVPHSEVSFLPIIWTGRSEKHNL
jgi:hypothetical protein